MHKIMIFMMLALTVFAIALVLDSADEKTPGDGIMNLPAAQTTGKMSLEETIAKRHSVRAYKATELTQEQVSQILWSAQGQIPGKRFNRRTAPSAGGIYPMQIYLLDKNGIHQYQPATHSIRFVKGGDQRADLAKAAFNQGFIKQAPVVLLVTGNVPKCAQRYGDRAQRYVDIEAGHIGQNVSLQAVALGLGCVMLGAFDDEAVSELIGLPKDETPLYIIPVGYPAE